MELVALGVDLRLARCPYLLEKLQGLVGQTAALPERHAERRELALHPAHAGAEDETAAGEHVHAREELRDRQRRPVGQDDHARAEQDPLGDAGQPRKDREGIEHLLRYAM